MTMSTKGWTFLKVLSNRYTTGGTDSLLGFLTQEEGQNLASSEIQSSNPDSLLKPASTTLSNIHYSWLANELKKMPYPLSSLIAQSLPSDQRKGVLKLLGLEETGRDLPPIVEEYLGALFLKRVVPKGLLPLDWTQNTRMKKLVLLSKNELLDVIDYLGIYDLTEEIRHIVNRKFLEKIYQSIPKQKQKFLKDCFHKKKQVATAPLELEKWDGTAESLGNILHRRGLARLGSALSGQKNHLVWYLLHKLDTGRAKIVKSFYSSDKKPRVTSVLVQQVINVLKFLNLSQDVE